jgi:hypothetical protein
VWTGRLRQETSNTLNHEVPMNRLLTIAAALAPGLILSGTAEAGRPRPTGARPVLRPAGPANVWRTSTAGRVVYRPVSGTARYTKAPVLPGPPGPPPSPSVPVVQVTFYPKEQAGKMLGLDSPGDLGPDGAPGGSPPAGQPHKRHRGDNPTGGDEQGDTPSLPRGHWVPLPYVWRVLGAPMITIPLAAR